MASEVPESVGRFPLDESKVTAVTNLLPGGPGSLRAALAEKGPRLIVFEVGGRDLKELDAGIAAFDGPAARSPANSPTTGPHATLTSVLRGAGSRPAERDAIDRRIVASVIAGTGRLIDSQDQVGGYPIRAETHRVQKVPVGGVARRPWLQGLMELASDRDLDLTPRLNRLDLPR